MTENKKVEVDGVTFDVELEADEQGWKATVEGKTFMIKFPDGGGVSKRNEVQVVQRKVELYRLTFLEKS